MVETKKYLISGRVQGVGYRWFVNKQAGNIGLNGSVRNLSDGRVEVIARGTSEQLEMLEFKLRQGPSISRVDSVLIIDYDWPGELPGFQIR